MRYKTLFLILFVIAGKLFSAPDLRVDVDLGMAFPGYNDVRIPNDEIHSKFSLRDDLSINPVLSSRLVLHYYVHPRHRISLLAAPLKFTPMGSFDRDITYQNKTFSADEQIKAVYRFDSYRLQYRYILPQPKWTIRSVGAALKIRDAEISLESATQKATKTNTGLVPLLSLEAGYKLSPKLELELAAEGLGSPFGRAEDIYLGMVYSLGDRMSLKAGYRFLEGGSDVDEVYTFALVHYATLGFRIKI